MSTPLQAVDAWPDRVAKLNDFFESWRSGDEYDREAITWVMACTSHLPGAALAPQPHPAAPTNYVITQADPQL